jgi:hypothetical protein
MKIEGKEGSGFGKSKLQRCRFKARMVAVKDQHSTPEGGSAQAQRMAACLYPDLYTETVH